jgi:hypothetical protein
MYSQSRVLNKAEDIRVMCRRYIQQPEAPAIPLLHSSCDQRCQLQSQIPTGSGCSAVLACVSCKCLFVGVAGGSRCAMHVGVNSCFTAALCSQPAAVSLMIKGAAINGVPCNTCTLQDTSLVLRAPSYTVTAENPLSAVALPCYMPCRCPNQAHHMIGQYVTQGHIISHINVRPKCRCTGALAQSLPSVVSQRSAYGIMLGSIPILCSTQRLTSR